MWRVRADQDRVLHLDPAREYHRLSQLVDPRMLIEVEAIAALYT